MVVDLDHLEDAEGTRNAAALLDYVALAFISPSGEGVKIVVPIEPVPEDASQHDAMFRQLAPQWAVDLGAEVDGSGKDVSRLCFASHDPDAHLNLGAEAMVWDAEGGVTPLDPPPPSGEIGPDGPESAGASELEKGKYGAVEATVANAIDRLAGAFAKAEDGDGNTELNRTLVQAFGYAKAGRAERAPIEAEWMRINGGWREPMDRGRCERTMESAWSAALPKRKKTRRKSLGRKSFRLDREGLIEAMKELGEGDDLRWNVRTGQLDISLQGGEWAQIDDLTSADLRMRLERAFSNAEDEHGGKPYRFGNDRWRLVTTSVGHLHRADPFLQWLEGLPKWDNAPRLDGLLEACFDVEGNDPKLVKWASRHTMMVAVERALNPGCDHHEIVVLVGAQGAGKSMYCRRLLAPNERKTMYAELRFVRDPKLMMEQVLGRVIVEWNEMGGLRGADTEAVKAWLTDTTDSSRQAYAQYRTDAPRMFALIGTANDDGTGVLPRDPSGHRRYGVIKVKDGRGNHTRVMRYLGDDREQLWAEALHRVRAGETARMPTDMALEQESAADAVAYENPTARERILRVLDKLQMPFTMAELEDKIAENVDHKVPVPNPNELARTLRSMGGESKRHGRGSHRRTMWTVPRPDRLGGGDPKDTADAVAGMIAEAAGDAEAAECRCDLLMGFHDDECENRIAQRG